MDPLLVGGLAALVVLASIPSWISGSILKRHAKQDGVSSALDWIPLGLLPYAFGPFQHKNKFAIVWAYCFSNLIILAAIIAFVVLRKG
jgi:hypothetical protein